jgi:Transposase IS116/IS110/IS902 family
MSEPKVLLGGLGIPESPRWHEGRLWCCNWIDRQVVVVGLDGRREVMPARGDRPMGYSIDWLPDGRLTPANLTAEAKVPKNTRHNTLTGTPRRWQPAPQAHADHPVMHGHQRRGGASDRRPSGGYRVSCDRAGVTVCNKMSVPGRQVRRPAHRSQHAIVASCILAHLDFLDAAIARLDEQAGARVADGCQPAARLLADVPGLERRSIEVIIAETGADMSRFPSPAHLASWAGMCPGNHESVGKRHRVATTPGNQWLRRTMAESARAAARTKGSYFSAQYRQIARRRGPNKAAVAVAHSLLDVIWHMLTTGEAFAALGEDYYTSRQDMEHQARRLISQLEKLGFTVELTAGG